MTVDKDNYPIIDWNYWKWKNIPSRRWRDRFLPMPELYDLIPEGFKFFGYFPLKTDIERMLDYWENYTTL